jgi:glycerol-3-phosphate dehydrogenase
MSYAIIGFGKIGQALAKAFARSGIAVSVATTRDPASSHPTRPRSERRSFLPRWRKPPRRTSSFWLCGLNHTQMSGVRFPTGTGKPSST